MALPQIMHLERFMQRKLVGLTNIKWIVSMSVCECDCVCVWLCVGDYSKL